MGPRILEIPSELLFKIIDDVYTSSHCSSRCLKTLSLVSPLFRDLAQPQLFREIRIKISYDLSRESYDQIETKLHFLSSNKICAAVQNFHIMGIQNSLTASALSSKLLNTTFTSLSRFPNLSKLHLRRILITTSILRSISICTTTSLTLDGCPANITSSEFQKDPYPLEFKLTHLTFIHLDVDVVNRYADPWWMILINPSTIQFLAIDGFHMPYTFITQLASPIMPPLKHLHTLELIANTLPPNELGIASKKMPCLTELTVNDPSQPFVEDDPSNSLDSQSHNFAQLFPEEVVPELKKVFVYYQIALPLCRGRQLQSVTTSGAMKEEEAVCLYEKLRDGSSNSLSSLSIAMETVTMEYLTNILTTFSTLRLLTIVMKKRARFTAAEARRMLLDVALPVTLYTFEVRKNTDSDGVRFLTLDETQAAHLRSYCHDLLSLEISCIDGTLHFQAWDEY